jgi:phosphohistidine phosphatase SixA
MRPAHLNRLWAAGSVALALLPAVVNAQPVIVLTRHAERLDQSTDSPLSAHGEARATRLADILSDLPITHIFATTYQRTQATVAPLAKAKGVETTVFPANDVDALTARLRALGPEATAVYAGHSNTVPAVLKGLGHPEVLSIADAEYSNLFIVVMRGAGPPLVLRLRY